MATQAHASSWPRALLDELREIGRPVMHRYRVWDADLQVDRSIRIPVADNKLLPLQATLYRPRELRDGPLPTILVMLPYGRHQNSEALRAGVEFGRAGFAVLTLDLRGYESDPLPEGRHAERQIPWQGVERDASAALDWIAAQTWSSGKVGTFGCSALGETQFALARAHHPAHQAMLVAGAGGAMGALNGDYGYFGIFEGGILQLATGYGWLASRGWLSEPYHRPSYADPDKPLAILSQLPVAGLVPGADNAWQFMTRTPLDDAAWNKLGYVSDQHRLDIPLLSINTWNDLTVDGTVALHRFAQTPAKQMILAPGGHCEHELGAPPPSLGSSWQQVYNDWFKRWLMPAPPASVMSAAATPKLPAVLYRIPEQTEWQSAAQWPPPAQTEQWHLQSTGSANSVRGDGTLVRTDAAARPPSLQGVSHNAWINNPANPVPSRGGPMCCTGSSALPMGRENQADVEARDDVLVFTSEPFASATDYAGAVQAELFVSTQAPDLDLIVRVTDVAPDGSSYNVQEGAQRVSVAQAGNKKTLLNGGIRSGEIFAVSVRARQIAHRFATGHRLRLHIAASSFPRLARNLQTGENSRLGTTMRAAEHRLHFSRDYPSRLLLPRLNATCSGRCK